MEIRDSLPNLPSRRELRQQLAELYGDTVRFITPPDKLARRAESNWAERDRKLEAARELRRQRRLERRKAAA